MKKLAVFVVFFICIGLILNLTSCMLLSNKDMKMNTKKDNGLHKGWFKNPHNPHYSGGNNPGKSKGHGKK